MIISLVILIFLIPLAFAPFALQTFFTPGEMDEMGVCLNVSEPVFESQ